VTSITPRSGDNDYLMSCLEKRMTCSNPYADDYCSSVMLSDAWLAQAQGCLGQACADVGACLKAIFKP